MSDPSTILKCQLEALDHLDAPIWFFDLDKLSMRWANRAAVTLWDARSLEHLVSRDFSGVSESTRIRLHSYKAGFSQGRTYLERWTFYPQGKPMVVECLCRQSPLAGLHDTMMVEGKLVPSTEGEQDALRMIEALRHTQVMISLYDGTGRPVLRNPAAISMFGAVGAGAGKLGENFVDAEEFQKLKVRLLQGKVYSAEIEQRTQHGTRWFGIDARMTADPVSGEGLYLLNEVDITRRKAAEEMRNKAIIEADNASRARARFLANVSHELRTPMNGVIGMTDLLLATSLDDEQRHYAETIQSSGESLLCVINDILDFSKIDAGRMELQEEAFDIVDIVRVVVDIVSGTLSGKPVRIECAFGSKLPQMVVGDSSHMKQIILNLVSNACKFTAQGTVTIRAMVVGGAQHRLRIEVEDSGIGIAEGDIPKLFQSFSQINSGDARRYTGTGLGLAICKQLVTSMQGDIGVTSTLGKGSLFWFELPLRLASAERPARSGMETAASVVDSEPLQVLLVEDNPVNQRVAQIMLTKLGHHVCLAPDGRDAITAAAAEPFDIIFMDIQMPEIDGYAATAAIRSSGNLNESTPIVALTANAMEGDVQHSLDAGMDGHLSKPVTLAQLSDAIQRFVRPAG